MTSQLNYLIVQQRHIELVYRAEHARLAKRNTSRRVGVVTTLESRPAPRAAPAPGCPLGRSRDASKARTAASSA